MFSRILNRNARPGGGNRTSSNDQIAGAVHPCDPAVSEVDGQGWTKAWFVAQPISIAAGRLHLAPAVLATSPKHHTG